jgi:hypothetical protein
MTSHTQPPPTIAARLLFLSASASEGTPLAVDREYNRVKTGLQSLGVWPAWREAVEHVPAVAWDQVPEQLLLHRASIVHFAGHGHPDGSLEFSTRDGGPQRIRPEGLAALFRSYAPPVRLVVLNACYSDALADALTEHVDVVIGMTHAIDDDAAIQFAPTFYQQLAGGTSVQSAFEVARGVLQGQLPGTRGLGRGVSRDLADAAAPLDPASEDLPLRIRVRAGVDASRMVFTIRDPDAAAGGSGWRRLAAAVRRRGALAVGAASLALAGLVASRMSHRPASADQLVVRVHEAGQRSAAHLAGRVTVNGPDTAVRARPLVDGEAVFDDLPAGSVGRAVEVSVDGIAGFQATTERHVVPESRVVGVTLTKAETTSVVTGTVVDARNQPIAGAVIDFENGLAVAETDPRGDFRIVLPLPPGTKISVTVAVHGTVGFRDNVTVPGLLMLPWAP